MKDDLNCGNVSNLLKTDVLPLFEDFNRTSVLFLGAAAGSPYIVFISTSGM